MAQYSYNGWLASANRADFGGLDNRVIPGTTMKLAPGVRAGDVATVLFYVAEQLHLRVEPIDEGHQGDDWGYSFRPNTNNPSQLSCHGSATAFDYNATRHPNGKSNTWTPAQVAEIKKILAEVNNVVVCLFGYDEMHFEVAGNATHVADAVAKIRGGNVSLPVPSNGKRALSLTKPFTTGEDVKVLQRVLNRWYPWLKLVEDGVFGPATDKGVRELQTRAKLAVDGIVGPATRKVIGL